MIVYRQADFGSPVRTEAARRSGRYHAASESSPTQYFCIHPLGPLAEFMRNHSTRQREQVLQIRVRTWAVRFEADGLRHIDFANAREFGLEPDDLVADDHVKCQEAASALRGSGEPGVVVPSAALPGTDNIVLFGPRVASPYLVEPLDEIDMPASITAQDGRPIVPLLDLVRFRGEPHAALEAWRNAEGFSFDEPNWEITADRLSA